MTKTKKNIWSKIGFITCAIVLLSTCLLSSTFAKYTSKVTGEATANVAVWSFKANNEIEKFSLDLTNEADPYVDSLGNTINKNYKDKTIAPGVYGSFMLVVDARGSEVNVDVNIEFANLKKPEHLKIYYKIGDKATNFPTAVDDLTEFKADAKISDIILKDAEMTKTINFYWTWVYEPTFTYTIAVADFNNEEFLTEIKNTFALGSNWTPEIEYNAGSMTTQETLEVYTNAALNEAKAIYNSIDTKYATVIDVNIMADADFSNYTANALNNVDTGAAKAAELNTLLAKNYKLADSVVAGLATTLKNDQNYTETFASELNVLCAQKSIVDTYLLGKTEKEKTDWITEKADKGITVLSDLKIAAKDENLYQPKFTFDLMVTGIQRMDANN